MVPEPSRRAVLRAVAAAGVACVAGCTGVSGGDGGSGDETTSAPTTTAEPTATTEETTEQATTTAAERTVDPADSPRAAVEAFVDAEDADAFQAPFHPLHAFSVEKLSRTDAEDLYENSTFPGSVTLERVDREVTVDLVASAALPGPDTDRSAIEDALAGSDAEVVEATFESETGTETLQFVTVERDGGWLILAHGVEPEGAREEVLTARVVSGVAFEPDRDAARVQFVSDVVADSVTVEAVQSGDSVTADAPGDESFLQVDVDPDGDEIVVRATVDGESRVVHRERYPESDRLVDDVEFVADPEGDSRDAIARVNFTYSGGEEDENEGGRVRVVSTVQGGEAEAEPVGSLRYLNVGVDPEGDEVVVTYPVGGDTEEVHRERVSP
jgi:hypothetical protein